MLDAKDNGTAGRDFAAAMAEHLSRYEWDHFVTLTTRNALAADGLMRAMKNRFLRCLARKAQKSLTWFYVVEGGEPLGGHHHLHALVQGTGGLTTRAIERSWPLGFTRVVRYSQRRGAAWYVAMHLRNPAADWDLSRRIVRRPETLRCGRHTPEFP